MSQNRDTKLRKSITWSAESETNDERSMISAIDTYLQSSMQQSHIEAYHRLQMNWMCLYLIFSNDIQKSKIEYKVWIFIVFISNKSFITIRRKKLKFINLRLWISSIAWFQTAKRSSFGSETLNFGQLPRTTAWWSRTGGIISVRLSMADINTAFLNSESWLLNPLCGAYQRNFCLFRDWTSFSLPHWENRVFFRGFERKRELMVYLLEKQKRRTKKIARREMKRTCFDLWLFVGFLLNLFILMLLELRASILFPAKMAILIFSCYKTKRILQFWYLSYFFSFSFRLKVLFFQICSRTHPNPRERRSILSSRRHQGAIFLVLD